MNFSSKFEYFSPNNKALKAFESANNRKLEAGFENSIILP